MHRIINANTGKTLANVSFLFIIYLLIKSKSKDQKKNFAGVSGMTANKYTYVQSGNLICKQRLFVILGKRWRWQRQQRKHESKREGKSKSTTKHGIINLGRTA